MGSSSKQIPFPVGWICQGLGSHDVRACTSQVGNFKMTPWEVGKKAHFRQVSKNMKIDELMYPKHHFMWVDVERLRCVTWFPYGNCMFQHEIRVHKFNETLETEDVKFWDLHPSCTCYVFLPYGQVAWKLLMFLCGGWVAVVHGTFTANSPHTSPAWGSLETCHFAWFPDLSSLALSSTTRRSATTTSSTSASWTNQPHQHEFLYELNSPKQSQNFIHPPLVTSPIPWGIQRGSPRWKAGNGSDAPPGLSQGWSEGPAEWSKQFCWWKFLMTSNTFFCMVDGGVCRLMLVYIGLILVYGINHVL